jgi:hypothetical protein
MSRFFHLPGHYDFHATACTRLAHRLAHED